MEAPRAQRRLLCPRAHRRGCLNGAGGLGRGALWELTQALSIWLQNHSLSTTGPMHAGRSGAGLRNGQSWGLEPMLGKTQKSREPAFFPREHRHIFIPLEHKPQHPGAQPEGHHPQAAVPRQQPLSWDVEDGLWPSAQRTPALVDTHHCVKRSPDTHPPKPPIPTTGLWRLTRASTRSSLAPGHHQEHHSGT